MDSIKKIDQGLQFSLSNSKKIFNLIKRSKLKPVKENIAYATSSQNMKLTATGNC